MSTIEITRVEDLREGDMVTLSWDGHEFTGPAWPDGDIGLSVGLSSVAGGSCHFVRATREVPDLPTSRGAVIRDVVVAGVSKCYQIGICRRGGWDIYRDGDVLRSVGGEEIVAWTPAKVVADGEQVSR